MPFGSILFNEIRSPDTVDRAGQPAFFTDLNLDQIVDSVVRGRDEYNLRPFFFVALADAESINYRQAIMRDLERDELASSIYAFAGHMRAVRSELKIAADLHYRWQKQRYFLDAVQLYCRAITGFVQDLESAVPQSSGLVAFLEYLKSYADSAAYMTLKREEARLRAALNEIRYGILIKGNSVTVRRYVGETDYSEEVRKAFEKFRQGRVKSHSTDMRDSPAMNHVEATVLDFVARLYPEVFLPLNAFCESHSDFIDSVIGRFEREIQFYAAYIEHITPPKETGLQFCYPEMSNESKEVQSKKGFDLALAEKLRHEHGQIVCNDFYLKGDERIIVVTGPNQGGKTTFARSFGQLHYLAALGLPVPGHQARLFLFDQIFTHFERQENMKNLRGKLHDDLFRIHRILGEASESSIILMNEIFSSTSLKDALYLSEKVMRRIMDLDALCVYVTFIEELSTLSAKTVSMLGEVVQDAVTTRTFRVVRRPADGRSYALSLAGQYRLQYEQLRERIAS